MDEGFYFDFSSELRDDAFNVLVDCDDGVVCC